MKLEVSLIKNICVIKKAWLVYFYFGIIVSMTMFINELVEFHYNLLDDLIITKFAFIISQSGNLTIQENLKILCNRICDQFYYFIYLPVELSG